jgi:hypothetical protein
VFENRELKRIFRPKREKITGNWRKFITRNFVTCILKKNINIVTKSRCMG